MAIDAGRISDQTGLLLIAAMAAQLGVDIDPAEELERARADVASRAQADLFSGPAPADLGGDGDAAG